MKVRYWLLGMVLFSSLHAKDVETSLEESLELRKIAEYWKEKDYHTAKAQIHDFLSKNPKSSYADQLYAMLGDLHFREKNYKKAATAYDSIEGKEFRLKCQFHHLHSLYETGQCEEFIAASDLFLKNPNATGEQIDTIRFELAESLFRIAHAPENEKRKKELFKEALAHYLQLTGTSLAEMAIEPQAQIYAFLEEHSKAASLYLKLAQKDTAKKEELLFLAGSLQLNFDKNAAIATFSSIVDLEGKNISKAAFNQLNLLFQEKRYKDFILAQDKALKHVPADKLPLMHYCLGKSLLKMRDFAAAIHPLSQSLASKSLDRVQEKSALIALIACAKETQDLSLFEKTLAHLKSGFADEGETANALLMHSQLCRDKKEWTKARADIQELLQQPSPHLQKESLLYDRALLFIQEGRWQEGATAFEEFIAAFPESAQRANALHHIVNARLEDARHPSIGTQKVKQEQLLDSLTAALQEEKTFTAAQLQKMRYVLGKTQFELCQYEEAIETLSDYVQAHPKDPTCGDAHLILAYCYSQGEQDEIHFVLNAEKTLSFNPHFQGALDLHVALFNAYLGLAEKAPADEKTDMIAKAADHLFCALDKPISPQNQRWLAGYYFQKYQSGAADAIERATFVLQKALENKKELHAMEAETVKLASIYEKTGNFKECAKLLENLLSEQQSHPELSWKYQRMAQFELGKTYQSLGQNEKAIQSYAELIGSSSHASSYFATAAQLEKAKLEFSMLEKEQCKEDAPAVMAICDALKSVQIKRKLHSEPLHLEAALCYVDIKTQLAAPEHKTDRKYDLLARMKESFSSVSDPLVNQYLASAAQFSDKQRLYEQYLSYVETEMLRLDAEKNQNAAQMKEAAQKLHQLLTESTDETLTQRIRKSTEALSQNL